MGGGMKPLTNYEDIITDKPISYRTQNQPKPAKNTHNQLKPAQTTHNQPKPAKTSQT